LPDQQWVGANSTR